MTHLLTLLYLNSLFDIYSSISLSIFIRSIYISIPGYLFLYLSVSIYPIDLYFYFWISICPSIFLFIFIWSIYISIPGYLFYLSVYIYPIYLYFYSWISNCRSINLSLMGIYYFFFTIIRSVYKKNKISNLKQLILQ